MVFELRPAPTPKVFLGVGDQLRAARIHPLVPFARGATSYLPMVVNAESTAAQCGSILPTDGNNLLAEEEHGIGALLAAS